MYYNVGDRIQVETTDGEKNTYKVISVSEDSTVLGLMDEAGEIHALDLDNDLYYKRIKIPTTYKVKLPSGALVDVEFFD